MKKLRVLQVNKLYYPYTGGIEHIVQQIAEGLKEKINIKVLVCSDKKIIQKEVIHQVSVIRVPCLKMLGNVPIPFGLAYNFKKLSKNCDIVQLHLPYPFEDLACFLSGYKGKVIIWWHSDVVRQKKMLYFYLPLMHWLLKRADIIIVATEGHIKGSKFLSNYSNKCVIIPYGVDPQIEQYADNYINNYLYKQQIDHVKKNKVRFLFVGRLVYYKGCDILLKAFVNVENAELILVGSGNQELLLKKLTKKLKIHHKTKFYGELSQKDLFKQFEQCDVLVLPSVARSEAFGIVQIEAMAFGKPVINTNLPSGVPYVSIHGETGITVEPNQIDDLTKAMNWMVTHPQERLELGKRARARMKQYYRMDHMLSNILELYQKERLKE